MRLKATVRLVRSPEMITSQRVGFWLNHEDVDQWLDAMLRSQELLGDEVDFYVLPPAPEELSPKNLVAKRTNGGLIGLPRSACHLHLTIMAIPLLPHRGKGFESCGQDQRPSLWLAQGTAISPEPPRDWLEAVLDDLSMQTIAPVNQVGAPVNQAGQDPPGEAIGTNWVWLPRVGLIALEASDRLTISDLLRLPQGGPKSPDAFAAGAAPRRWAAPPRIPVAPDRIAGFAIIGEADNGQPLNDLADEIGHKASDLIHQPLDPSASPAHGGRRKERGGKRQSLGQRGKEWLLNKLDHWFGGNAGAATTKNEPKRPGKVAGRGGISLHLYRMLASAVQDKRNEQLQKLLEMSKRDPDKALQFAIPLVGEGGFRGLAVPGSKLLSQIPNFSLSGLSGGGAADFWGMEYQYQQQLRRAYLEMANRETAAGRYRRAAYIHAHLLGDFSAAAGALEQGGFFREAAQLYREKLKLPAEQARCLVSAGMFEQAAEIYETLNDFLSSGGVWEKAGRPEEAAAAYSRAFKQLQNRGNMLEAADLLANKMSQREAAKSLLWAQWPMGKNSLRCAATYFEMLAEDFQHELALSQTAVAVEAGKELAPVSLASLLEQLAKHYPDSRVHEFAVDQCRAAVATTLNQPGSLANPEVLQILKRLDQDDQILQDDCVRYLKLRREADLLTRPTTAPTTAPTNRGKLSTNKIQLLYRLILPPHRYELIQRSANGLLAVYQREDEYKLRLFASSPEPGRSQRTTRNAVPLTDEIAVRVPITSVQEYEVGMVRNLFLHRTGSSATPSGDRANTGFNFVDAAGGHYRLSTKHPAALDECEAIVCAGPNSWFGLENTHGVWSAKSCGAQSEHLRYWRLPEPEKRDTISFEDTWVSQEVFEKQIIASKGPRCLLDTVDRVPVVAIDRMLIYGFNEGKQQTATVKGTILSLGLWPPGTRKRIAVGHDQGLAIVWPELGKLRLEVACERRPYQHLLWMQAGRLFAISDHVLYRFYVRNYEVELTGSYSLHKMKVVSLVDLTPGICGVCYEDGSIDCF